MWIAVAVSGPIVIAVVAALASPLVAYAVSARQLSGKIKNSTAADLWQANSELRKDVMKENSELRALYAECRQENTDLKREVERLRERLENWEPANGVA